MQQPKTMMQKLTDLNNAVGSLKFELHKAFYSVMPLKLHLAEPLLKQQIILEYPQPYCCDRYGCCEENEKCYCNRQECPNVNCDQLLTSLLGTEEIINCHHCGAQITIIK